MKGLWGRRLSDPGAVVIDPPFPCIRKPVEAVIQLGRPLCTSDGRDWLVKPSKSILSGGTASLERC